MHVVVAFAHPGAVRPAEAAGVVKRVAPEVLARDAWLDRIRRLVRDRRHSEARPISAETTAAASIVVLISAASSGRDRHRGHRRSG